jgi:hypothetical protein
LNTFAGGGQPPDTSSLNYEAALEALLSLIGRQVLVLFSGLGGSPFISGVISGRLDRGELDERLQALFLRADDALIETLFFHVGTRQSGFVIRPDEFARAFWQTERQLTIHLGECAVTVVIAGELGDSLGQAADDPTERTTGNVAGGPDVDRT